MRKYRDKTKVFNDELKVISSYNDLVEFVQNKQMIRWAREPFLCIMRVFYESNKFIIVPTKMEMSDKWFSYSVSVTNGAIDRGEIRFIAGLRQYRKTLTYRKIPFYRKFIECRISYERGCKQLSYESYKDIEVKLQVAQKKNIPKKAKNHQPNYCKFATSTISTMHKKMLPYVVPYVMDQ